MMANFQKFIHPLEFKVVDCAFPNWAISNNIGIKPFGFIPKFTFPFIIAFIHNFLPFIIFFHS